MRAAYLAVVALAACGRFGFVEPDDARGEVVSGDDADPGEPCNGIDDDDDWIIDEGCPCTPMFAVIDTPGLATSNTIAWTGSGFITHDNDGVTQRLLPIDLVGAPGPTTDVVTTGAGKLLGNQGIAWTGEALGVTWLESGRIYAALYDPSTRALGPARDMGVAFNSAPRIVWAHDRLAVVWYDGARLHVVELSAAGVPLGGEILIDAAGVSFDSVTATPGGYAFGITRNLSLSDPAIVIADRPTFAPTMVTPGFGSGMGEGFYVSVAASATSLLATWNLDGKRVQLLGLDGSQPTPAIPYPKLTHSVLTAGADRFRLSGFVVGNGTLPVVSYEIAPGQQMASAPTTVSSFISNGSSTPHAIEAAGRLVFVEYHRDMMVSRLLVFQACF